MNLGGYTGRLRELLEPRGWEVLNVSRGGDNTITITPRFEPEGDPDPGTRYLTPVDPGYVVIALSLGNEGIMRCPPGQPSPRCADSREAADAVAQQFADGLQRLIARAREHGIVPVIGLTYTRGDFTEAEYAHTRATNLLDQHVGRAERQPARRHRRRLRPLGAGLLPRADPSQRGRPHRDVPRLRADPLRRARGGQADPDALRRRRLRAGARPRPVAA